MVTTISPWWAQGLRMHFCLENSWILKKFIFCSKYQSKILKVAWYVAFGLCGHSKMSFWKNCCLFTFYDFLLIFNNSSILIRSATKMCLFINSGQYLWTKWWNSANKKWRVLLCLSHRSKKVHNIPKLSSLSKAEKKPRRSGLECCS